MHSPLIVLARIGRENLLSALADQIAVLQALTAEIQAGSVQD
jgi:predicted nucleic acid-binding protein